MKKHLLTLLVASAVLTACETEVDLNAPYKNTTVIFGLLDPDFNGDNQITVQDTQWIKINKTFLGEGDNTAYAAIRDSSEYKDSDFLKKVVERIVDGEVVEEFELVSSTISNRQMNGIFYGPAQTMYYFVPSSPGLNQNSEYRIVLQFTDGREVTAKTQVVSYNNFAWITPQQNATFILASVSTAGGFNYTSEVAIRWNAAGNASMYDAKLRFHFIEEVYENSDWSGVPISVTPKFLDYYLGSISNDDITSGQLLKITFDGRAFFSFLQNNLVADQRIRRVIGTYDVEQQRTECFDVMLTMGNSDFKSYIEVNTPSTGVAQERPIYTNVSNGIGLFASRGTRNLVNLPLVAFDNNNQPNSGNLSALVQSEYTAALNFCDPSGSSDFPCGN
ncbi:MAG: hypothetical protein ACKO7B_15335 [Flavobacteriales bacterium]